MPSQSNRLSALALRLATVLFPPLGLVLLWRGGRSLGKKLLGTAGILLYSCLYAGLVIFLLVRTGALVIEWRGGYVPALARKQTKPDFEAVERNRAQQAKTASPPSPRAEGSAYWNGFRGPRRDGVYGERAILTNWPSGGLRRLWRQPCGGGYASFAVAEGLAFTIEQRRESEVVVAYEIEKGREVWGQSWPARFSEYYGGEGPRATPAYDEGKVYAAGAEGEFRCLEAKTGKELWAKNIVVEHHGRVPTYGISTSPLIVGETLIVLTGAGHGKSVVAYDKRDGKRLWSALDDVTGYASPMFMTLAGQPQIIVCAETRTMGLRVEDGGVLWECPWRVQHNQLPIAQPVMLETNRFLLSAGYFTGCAAFEVVKSGSGFAARSLWQNKNLKNKFTSSVFREGYVYGLDEDILTCLDATTGERKWKDGRYGYGQLLLASGHLVILSGDGELALVKATPEGHHELARFPAIQGKTWNHPAIADGKILVRNLAEMACFEISNAK
jgi:outer membrane protein assembly factor BamB